MALASSGAAAVEAAATASLGELFKTDVAATLATIMLNTVMAQLYGRVTDRSVRDGAPTAETPGWRNLSNKPGQWRNLLHAYAAWTTAVHVQETAELEAAHPNVAATLKTVARIWAYVQCAREFPPADWIILVENEAELTPGNFLRLFFQALVVDPTIENGSFFLQPLALRLAHVQEVIRTVLLGALRTTAVRRPPSSAAPRSMSPTSWAREDAGGGVLGTTTSRGRVDMAALPAVFAAYTVSGAAAAAAAATGGAAAPRLTTATATGVVPRLLPLLPAAQAAQGAENAKRTAEKTARTQRSRSPGKTGRRTRAPSPVPGIPVPITPQQRTRPPLQQAAGTAAATHAAQWKPADTPPQLPDGDVVPGDSVSARAERVPTLTAAATSDPAPAAAPTAAAPSLPPPPAPALVDDGGFSFEQADEEGDAGVNFAEAAARAARLADQDLQEAQDDTGSEAPVAVLTHKNFMAL